MMYNTQAKENVVYYRITDAIIEMRKTNNENLQKYHLGYSMLHTDYPNCTHNTRTREPYLYTHREA